MGARPRNYRPNTVYCVTIRCIQGRFLMRPGFEANRRIAGAFGKAQKRWPSVQLHGTVALSNHLTTMISSPDPELICAFLGFVHKRISDEMDRLHNWRGTLWESRPKVIPIKDGDEAAMIDRMKYLLAQGCTKDGLVESPRDWPGFTCVKALLGEEPALGVWYDHDRANKAMRRKNPQVALGNFATTYRVEFAPLPCWEHLPLAEQENRITDLVAQIYEETLRAWPRDSRPVLGRRKVLNANPHDHPGALERSPAPLVHASTRAGREEYEAELHEYVSRFRAAAERRKRGLPAVFPLYSFPPGEPMVLSSA